MKKKFGRWFKKYGGGLLVGIVLIFINLFGNQNAEALKKMEVDYNTFQEQVTDKKVVKAQISRETNTVYYQTKGDKRFFTTYPDYPEFKKELLENGVDVTIKTKTNYVSMIFSLLQFAFFGFIIYFVFTQMKGKGGDKNLTKVIENPNVNFSNVAGYKEVLSEVQTAVDILKNGEKYREKGARMPKGMILYGDPGTGKTLIAKAIAGEAGVPFFSTNGGDFIEKFVGVGAQRIRNLFEEAKKKAPCIIFIDEIDAIGGVRDEQSNSEQVQTINALLTQLDGFTQDSGVFVIATTNRLESLDPALIRTGRFDLHVKVPLPYTAEERVEIMNVHAKGKVFAEDVEFLNLAKQWVGFSGADIEGLFNSAAIISVTEDKDEIDLASIDEAFNKKVLKGHFKKDGQANRNKDELKLIAYHEAGHAVVGKLLQTGMDVSKVTILSSTTGAGGVTFFNPTKMGLLTINELESRVKVSYAGRIAELLLFGDENLVTTGASGDIEQATANIKEMISSYGMNKKVGMLNLNLLGADKSVLMEHSIELSERLYNETEAFMKENWNLVEKVALSLLEKETISEAELDVLMNEELVSQVPLLPTELVRAGA